MLTIGASSQKGVPISCREGRPHSSNRLTLGSWCAVNEPSTVRIAPPLTRYPGACLCELDSAEFGFHESIELEGWLRERACQTFLDIEAYFDWLGELTQFGGSRATQAVRLTALALRSMKERKAKTCRPAPVQKPSDMNSQVAIRAQRIEERSECNSNDDVESPLLDIEARMTDIEQMRRKEERQIARNEAMISNINERLNFTGRTTPLPYTTGQAYHQMTQELTQSFDQVRSSIWWIDEEMGSYSDARHQWVRGKRRGYTGTCKRCKTLQYSVCNNVRACIPCTVPYAQAQAHVTQTTLAIAGLIFRISFTFPSK